MKVERAVILAGGLGTRFMPATLGVAKEMFPIIDKPILFYHLKECVDSGITKVLIVTNKRKKEINNFLDYNGKLVQKVIASGKQSYIKEYLDVMQKLTIDVVYQKRALGSGDAVGLAKKWCKAEPFVLFNGDDIIDSAVPASAQLIEVYNKTQNAVVAFQEVSRENISKYGSAIVNGKVDGGSFLLGGLVEKPEADKAPSLYAVIGRYVVTNEVMENLKNVTPKNGEYYFTDALGMVAENGNASGKVIDGVYRDCGNKLEFAKAQVAFTLKDPDIGPKFAEYLKNL